MLLTLQQTIRKLKNPKKIIVFQRFFKTGRGEYGFGDVFLGLTVPQSRIIALKFKKLSLQDVRRLLHSKYHEERLVALFILVERFAKADKNVAKTIFDLYLTNTKFINNWDLIDLSAPKIVGPFLLNRSKAILYKLAASKSIWERRIAIMGTFHFIKNKDFTDALKIATILVNDKHDLIQKAVGWMLREIGNRDQKIEEEFLKKHYKQMPRTMLRYAIEKFPEKLRLAFLHGRI
ncbi:MAG: DNA alkylation repair protein [Candidatus Levybacteria bacterium]|nr:DNA alkylation repair protein [Candidatus Levybacteria bacterium]